MNFHHSLLFSCMYYFKIYLGALQIRRLYVDGGGLAIMAAGHDPCRRLLIIFLGGLYFILPALHLIFPVYFPLFIFSFLFSENYFLFYSSSHLTKTKCVAHQRCRLSLQF